MELYSTKSKASQTIIAMITEDKITELFCIANDFCKFFEAMMEKYTIKEAKKRNYHRNPTLSKAEVMLRKRAVIETVNDELKNIAQVEHFRHRYFDNFVVNILGALATYCCFPKKRVSMFKEH